MKGWVPRWTFASGCLLALAGCGSSPVLDMSNLGPPVNSGMSGIVVENPRDIAGSALGRIGAPAAPALAAALSDPDPAIRIEACRALAYMGPAAKEAVPALVQALSDPDRGIRQQAAIALGEIGPAAAAAVPPLMQMLREKR